MINNFSITNDYLNCVYWDWHQSHDHAIGFVSLSQTNELFVWDMLNLSPYTYTTEAVCRDIASVFNRADCQCDIALIDPLANARHGGSRNGSQRPRTVVEDINDIFSEMYKIGEINDPINFETFDTKSTYGREQLAQRLKNSVECGKPFNNIKETDRGRKYLPTIWILKNCTEVYKSIANWSTEKDGKPKQRWSHHCTGLECVLKDERFRPKVTKVFRDTYQYNGYFNSRRKVLNDA